MNERVEKKAIVIPCILFSLIALSMLLKEIPLLKDHSHFMIYLIGRVSIILSFLFCLLLSLLQKEIIYSCFPVLFYFLAMIYAAHGQYFQPNYWLAYIEFTTIFPFIFSVDRRVLVFLMISGLAIFDVSFFTTAKDFIKLGYFTQELFVDVFIGTIITTLIAYVTAQTFIKEKMQKNQIYQRFIDLGKNVSSIVHDIKGMISGPCTYSEMLHKKVQNGELSQNDGQLVGFLREDISSIRDFVMEMNQLVSSHVTEQENIIKISDVVRSISRVFKSKIKKIKIEVIGDLRLRTKVDYLNRIMINSIVNSCEAIHKNNKSDGKITIYCEHNFLGIADNSGEQLNDETLKKLNNPYITFTSKTEGSGLGILLIKDYINAMGGKFLYYNHAEGVSLKITFPKKIVLENERVPTPDFSVISPTL